MGRCGGEELTRGASAAQDAQSRVLFVAACAPTPGEPGEQRDRTHNRAGAAARPAPRAPARPHRGRSSAPRARSGRSGASAPGRSPARSRAERDTPTSRPPNTPGHGLSPCAASVPANSSAPAPRPRPVSDAASGSPSALRSLGSTIGASRNSSCSPVREHHRHDDDEQPQSESRKRKLPCPKLDPPALRRSRAPRRAAPAGTGAARRLQRDRLQGRCRRRDRSCRVGFGGALPCGNARAGR